MPDDNEAIAHLISKYLHNELTPAERIQLKNWIARSRTNRVRFEKLTDIEVLNKKLRAFLLPKKGQKSAPSLTRFR
jgi:hypothetical protein